MAIGIDPNDIFHNGGWYSRSGIANFITPDSSGNIIANVVPRTGTLASLTTLAGGLGELASATDANAIVKYNGVAGQAKISYITSQMGITKLNNNAAQTAIVPNTATVVALQSALFDDLAMADTANNAINSPAGGSRMEVSAGAQFESMAATVGTFRNLTIQLEAVTNLWIDLYVLSVPVITNIRTDILINTGMMSAAGVGKRVRLTVKHDATGNASLTSSANNNYLTLKHYQ